MNLNIAYAFYIVPLAIAVAWYLRGRHRSEREHVETLESSIQSGLTEPPSLHPVIDTHLCIGSGSCVRACPEGALGMIAGKAVLTNPSACIGHGACHAACPVDGITLVFGTERRGIDIPDVRPNFESNVPGVFIAGELGGMGLIRKAAEQGRQAMESIARLQGGHADHDVVIVGSGPAGISAGLCALEKGLRYVLLEQEHSLGGSVFHYPRNKVAMTAPVNLSLVGKMKFTEVGKEKLLEFWENVVLRTRLKIHYGERMESIVREGDAFVVNGSKLWTFDAQTAVYAAPITYELDGVQYIAASVGGTSGNDYFAPTYARMLVFKVGGNVKLPPTAPYTPPVLNPPASTATAEVIARGGQVYEEHCSVCHGAGAVQQRSSFPNLTYTPFLHSQEGFDQVVLKGVKLEREQRAAEPIKRLVRAKVVVREGGRQVVVALRGVSRDKVRRSALDGWPHAGAMIPTTLCGCRLAVSNVRFARRKRAALRETSSAEKRRWLRSAGYEIGGRVRKGGNGGELRVPSERSSRLALRDDGDCQKHPPGRCIGSPSP